MSPKPKPSHELSPASIERRVSILINDGHSREQLAKMVVLANADAQYLRWQLDALSR